LTMLGALAPEKAVVRIATIQAMAVTKSVVATRGTGRKSTADLIISGSDPA
jgi:hypothetical protein